MPFHGSASADAELHNPRGVGAVPLDLPDDDANAYRMRIDDGSTYPSMIGVQTTTGAVTLSLGNPTTNPAIYASTGGLVVDLPQTTSAAVVVRRGVNDPIIQVDTKASSSPHNIRIREAYATWDEIPSEPAAVADKVHVYAYDNAGTVELRARTTAGIVNLLDTGSSLTGTTNLSWTVDEDASAAANTDPFVRLLGGDGVAAPNDDLVRSTLTQDSSAEVLDLRIERARNGGGYVEMPTRITLNSASYSPGVYGGSYIDFGQDPATATVVINNAAIDYVRCVAVGSQITIGADDSTAIGYAAKAATTYGTSLGSNAEANDDHAVALGYDATTRTVAAGGSEGAVAIGSVSRASADHAVALGRQANAEGLRSMALGYSSGATATGSIAIGDAGATANQAIALGDGATSGGAAAIAIGDTASATAADGIAIGKDASAGHAGAVAIGRGAASTFTNELVIGSATSALADLFVGRGVTSATTGTTTINATGGSGSNIAGHGLTLAAGRSTGNAKPAALSLQLSKPTSSGSTLQTLFTAGAIEHAGEALSGSGNALAHHYRRSEDVAAAGSYSWHVWHSKADATPFDVWSLDLANFRAGALLAAGAVAVYARVIASGLYSGTRRSALYHRRARYEVNGTAATIIDTGNSQHIGSDLEDTAGWDCEFLASSATIKLQCTGDADHATGWHADIWVTYTPDG